jgi:hypothetical protein
LAMLSSKLCPPSMKNGLKLASSIQRDSKLKNQVLTPIPKRDLLPA